MNRLSIIAALVLTTTPAISAEYAAVVGNNSVALNAFPTERVGVSIGTKKNVNPLTKNLAGGYCISIVDDECIEGPYNSLGYFNSASSTQLSLLYKITRTEKVDVYARLGVVDQPTSEVKEAQAPYTSYYNYQGNKRSKYSVSGGVGVTYKFTDKFGAVIQYDSHLGAGVGLSVKL